MERESTAGSTGPEVHYAKTGEEFLESLRRLGGAASRGFIHRGQGRAEWGLVPKAFRPEARFIAVDGLQSVEEVMRLLAAHWTAGSNSEREMRIFLQRRLEIGTLIAFFSVADEAGLSLPEDSQLIRAQLQRLQEATDQEASNWPPLEIRSILALAQHHGLPTRLLDWTWDWQVAAFFAVKDNLKIAARGSSSGPPSLAVWSLDALRIESFQQTERWHADLKKRGLPLPDVAPSSFLQRLQLVTAPGATNPNLRAQNGLFTLLEPLSGEPISAATPLEELDQPSDGARLRKLVLPSASAPEVLFLLSREGITAASVFPGYDGVVQSLKDRAIWKKHLRTWIDRQEPPH